MSYRKYEVELVATLGLRRLDNKHDPVQILGELRNLAHKKARGEILIIQAVKHKWNKRRIPLWHRLHQII